MTSGLEYFNKINYEPAIKAGITNPN